MLKLENIEPHIHAQLKLNLKKIQGMLKRIDILLDDEKCCEKLSQQINATIGLLQAMNRNLLKVHLKTFGIPTILSADTTKINEFIEEFLKVVDITVSKK